MPLPSVELQDKEAIVSYGKAIYVAAKKVIEKYRQGHDGIINPSRGANPITRCIIDTIGYIGEQGDRHAKRLHRGMYVVADDGVGKSFPVVPIPLTADVDTNTGQLEPYGLKSDDVVDSIRAFGANFIRALERPPEDRLSVRYFRLLDWVFSELEKRPNVSKSYRELPPVRKPIFIDTAISGRASSTILKELDPSAYPVYPIIFVDRNGQKLRDDRKHGNWKSYLEGQQRMDALKLVTMKRIVSEDQGAALLGVYAVFYPQLCFELMRQGALPHVSTVTWHSVYENDRSTTLKPYRVTFESFMDVLRASSVVMHSLEKALGGDIDELSDEQIVDLLETERPKQNAQLDHLTGLVRVNMKKYDVPKTEDADSMRGEFPFPIEDSSYESRSHVMHIHLPPKEMDKRMRELQRVLFA